MKYILSLLMAVLFYAMPTNASLWGNDGVQSKEYVYDFAVDGGATGTIDLAKGHALPTGAHLLDVYYHVETAFTSGGSATVALGDAASSTSIVSTTAFDNAAYALAGITKDSAGQPRVCSATSCKPQIVIATAAVTAGKVRIHYLYIQPK